MDSFIDQKCTFWKCAKNWAGPFTPPSFGQNPKESIIFSGEYLFGETKTCKFLTAAFSFVYEREIFPIKLPIYFWWGSKQKESRGWLSVLHVPLAGRGKVVRPTTTCTASTRIFFTMSAWRCIARQVNLGLQTQSTWLVFRKQSTQNLGACLNCLSLALVKSLSVNERVTDITTIGLVLVWCPVLPGQEYTILVSTSW